MKSLTVALIVIDVNFEVALLLPSIQGFERLDKVLGVGTALMAVFVMKILDEYVFSREPIEPDLRDYLGGILVRHIMSYGQNTQRATDVQLNGKDCAHLEVADVVHPTLSLFNFSCDANMLAFHVGSTLVARARRPILKGELIAHPVIWPYWKAPLQERKYQTEELRGFKCECRACVENWPTRDVLLERGCVNL